MKLTSSIVACGVMLLLTSTAAFTTPTHPATSLRSTTTTPSCSSSSSSSSSSTQRFMFGGGGAGAPTEDDPEAMKQMEAAAAQMGMSLAEYQLGIKARMKLNEDLSSMRIKEGDEATVSVNRDANNPPQFMEIKITEAGKELGKDAVSEKLVASLKQAQDAARTGRGEAQKKMMVFIGDEMKRIEGK